MQATRNFLIVFFFFLYSCSNKTSKLKDCIEVKLKDADFTEISFGALPSPIKDAVIKLATIDKKMDTTFSLESRISYSYFNPGDGKGYTEQVLKSRHMHFINDKCYEFLLYAKPYIIYDNKIFCLAQNLPLDCSSGECQPDTSGLSEISLYTLSLKKIL